jgi:nitrate/nitrite transporter NarK
LSLALLAISLWMRLKLSESPVFEAMKAEGEIAGNPFVESFTYPKNKRRIFIALFGVAAGLTVIWYTAMFSGLSFLKGPMRVEDTAAEIIVGISAFIGMIFFIWFGKLSDRIGRKIPIVWGYALTLLMLFPLFWLMGSAANPGLAAAAERAPVVVSGDRCEFDPFAKKQEGACGVVLGQLSQLGVSYTRGTETPVGAPTDWVIVKAGDTVVDSSDIQKGLEAQGYNFAKQVPSAGNIAPIMLALLGLCALSGATYGPVAALLSEMFPPRMRYSSMSIPYHIGTGYFGGFLPFIASYIVATTGDPYAGLWYTMAVVLVAFIVAAWGLKGGKPTDFADG